VTNRSSALIPAAGAIGIAALGLSSVRTAAVPLCITLLVAALFIEVLRKRDSVAPVGEIGAWYVMAVTVYTGVPVAIFLVLGGEYTPLNDARLFAIQPTPSDVARIGWMYCVHLIAFGASYLSVRGKIRARHPLRVAIPNSTLWVAIAIWGLLTLFSFATSIQGIRAENYAQGYATAAALPLAIRQVLKLAQGVTFIVIVVILISLFGDYTRRKWAIFAWLLFQLTTTLLIAGARTGLVLSVAACVLLYHTTVRPISGRAALLAGAAGLMGFTALGVLRTLRSFGSPADFQSAPRGGEFEAVFANAVDLDMKTRSGEIRFVPLELSISDLLSPIPSQVLPFEKLNLADWYVSRFYPEAKERGEGLAFGVVSQSLIGFGWLDLVLRGAVLGYIFARVHRYFRHNGHRLWVTAFYVWLTVWCYQSVRNSSFDFVGFVLQQFVPTVIAIEMIRAVFVRVSRPSSSLELGLEPRNLGVTHS
jgi:hypothetical protein